MQRIDMYVLEYYNIICTVQHYIMIPVHTSRQFIRKIVGVLCVFTRTHASICGIRIKFEFSKRPSKITDREKWPRVNRIVFFFLF